MQAATHHRLLARVQAELAHGIAPAPAFTIPAARYRDPVHHERELRTLFGGIRGGVWTGPPRAIAAASQLAPGACLPVDVPGAALLLTRDGDGIVRGFANACRHRASRLVDAPGAAKAVVCPYHGWTYDLRGRLMHAPHAETFGTHCEHRDLHPVAVAEHHGLIWLADGDVTAFLGALDGDLSALGLAQAAVWRTARTTRRCNWKLVVEAFLDGYHVRILHRDSIYRFFLDAASVAEPVGPHIRAVTARKPLRAEGALDTVALHELGTPSYLVFPSTVLIEHPDFVSVINVLPLAPDACTWEHTMLVPAARLPEVDHWAKSWALIEDTVFAKEDLWICEQIQRGIADGTTEELLFGSLEVAVQWFHTALGY